MSLSGNPKYLGLYSDLHDDSDINIVGGGSERNHNMIGFAVEVGNMLQNLVSNMSQNLVGNMLQSLVRNMLQK